MTGSEPDCMCITQGKDKDPDSNTNAIEMQKCGNKAYAKLGLTFPTKEQVMESRQRQTSVKIFESDADNQTHQRHVMGCLAKIQQAVPAYASRSFSKDCAADCAAENELKPLCLAMCGNPDAMKARPSGGRPQ